MSFIPQVSRIGTVPGQRTYPYTNQQRGRSVTHIRQPSYSMPCYTPPRDYRRLSHRYNHAIPLTNEYAGSSLTPLISVIAAIGFLILFLPFML